MATFVQGIGPPLEQIVEDHFLLAAESQASRDIIALVTEVRRLREICGRWEHIIGSDWRKQ